ncbi:MAG: insulinase family protein, partial [Desulfofustis sp.]|nr:insulinase family protein [Desulfofustis sp.]
HEQSTLEPDPSIYFGRLENGLRFVLQSNTEPRDRVAVYLNVEAGSLHEKRDERGLAHYLEHMLFNGTIHFPPGELIDYFRSIGMSFGADVNGYTTYTDTVYKLVVPLGTEQSLDQALLVMRDYADGALLLEEEIERERGVILAEKTARDSARYRSAVARNTFVLRNTPFPDRQPIGDEQVLLQAGQDELRGFYRRWYRPENMVLILVGDFDLTSTKELVAEHFDSMQNTEPVVCPEYGVTDHAGIETFYHYDPELGATDVAIETLRNKVPENDSLRLQQDNILRYMASMIINHRLDQLQESVESPFTSAGYYDTVMFDRFRITGIRASTKKENWQQSLALIESELRKVLDYGISESELERVKRDLRSDLENAFLSADTRNSMHLISQIVASLDAHRVLLSPAQELELFAPFVEAVTIEEVNHLFRDNWATDIRLVQVNGDAELTKPDSGDELLAFYETLKDRKIAPPEQLSIPSFPYLIVAEGPKGRPVKNTTFADIGAQRFDFANGLILNLKNTDFKKNQVRAALHFGDGQRSLPKKGVGMLASSVVNGSGTARLTATELEAALSGTSVRHSFRVAEESFVLSAKAVSSELELMLQVLHALLNDPGFRSSVYERSMKNFESMYRRLENSIEGGARLYLDNFFSGNAKSSGLPPWIDFSTLQLDDVVDWLKPYFQGAPLELTIVGDFDPDRVIELAAKYFDVPGQRVYMVEAHPQAQFPVGQYLETTVQSSVDKVLVRYAWLTDDYHDIRRTRRLHVLAATLEERLRKKIREELGAVYSPSVYSLNSRIYQGYGAIYADVVVEESLVDTVRDALDEIESSFTLTPVDNKELRGAQSPILTSLKDGLRTNSYWLHSVLSLSSRNSDQLQWPLTLIDDFGSISSGEINDLAQRYIRSNRRAVGIVRSEGSAEFSSVDQGANSNGVFPDDNG